MDVVLKAALRPGAMHFGPFLVFQGARQRCRLLLRERARSLSPHEKWQGWMDLIYLIPSGNQTWRAGNWTIHQWFEHIDISIHRGFSIAMFDYQRVYLVREFESGRFFALRGPSENAECWPSGPRARGFRLVARLLLHTYVRDQYYMHTYEQV